MENVIHRVQEIDTAAREAIERLLGQPLDDDARLMIEVLKQPPTTSPDHPVGGAVLADWCDVYVGLSDEEIGQIEAAVLQRAQLSRPSP